MRHSEMSGGKQQACVVRLAQQRSSGQLGPVRRLCEVVEELLVAPADRSSVLDDPRHSRQRTALSPSLPLRLDAAARQASYSVDITCWTRARAGMRALVTRSLPGKTFTPANSARSSPSAAKWARIDAPRHSRIRNLSRHDPKRFPNSSE